MGIDRGTLRQFELLLQPIKTRLRSMVARGVVKLVNDAKKLQLLQVDGFVGGPADGAEHFQPYGFSSVPLEGAEALLIFPSGDQKRPFVIATSDRRYRPTGGEPGEVTIYGHTGASMTMTKDGDIKARAAAGREVMVDDGSGTLEPVVKRSEFHGHTHLTAGTGAPVPPSSIVPTAPQQAALDASFPGTETLKVK